MKAIILAGGKATRLRPLSCNTTKSMVPVLNRPFLEYIIGYLRKHDVNDIILTLSHESDQIKSYFGDGSKFGVEISYLIEDLPLGSAGAVKNAEEFLDSPFIVFNGDIFTDLDLTAMVNLHSDRKARMTIALTTVDDPTIYGIVEIDSQCRVKCFKEKPRCEEVTTNMINAGVYVLEPEILDYIPSEVFFTFEHDIFPAAIEGGQAIYGYPFEGYWIDIGTPEKYLKLNHDLLKRYFNNGVEFENEGFVHPTARIEGPVLIGGGCTVDRNCVIKGLVALGSGCQIAEGAIVEGALLWRDCKIGKGTKLKNCVLASNCYVGDETEILDNCVLGDNVTIGKGNKLPQGVRVWPDKSIEANSISLRNIRGEGKIISEVNFWI